MGDQNKEDERKKIEARYEKRVAFLQRAKAQKQSDLDCILRNIEEAENEYRLDIQHLENSENTSQN